MRIGWARPASQTRDSNPVPHQYLSELRIGGAAMAERRAAGRNRKEADHQIRLVAEAEAELAALPSDALDDETLVVPRSADSAIGSGP